MAHARSPPATRAELRVVTGAPPPWDATRLRVVGRDVVFPDGEVREKGRASANQPELVWRGRPEQLAEEHGGITVAAQSPQRKPTPSDTREKKSGLAMGERKGRRPTDHGGGSGARGVALLWLPAAMRASCSRTS
jgi:hypothetical protein